jgi:hypothetical protein
MNEITKAALELGSSTLFLISQLLDSFGAVRRSVPKVEALASAVLEAEREIDRGRNQDSNVAWSDEKQD